MRIASTLVAFLRGNMKDFIRLIAVVCSTGIAMPAKADPTPNLYGALGLNTIPSARMEKTGTARFNISHADPYLNTSLGFQIHDRLYLGLRQSSEISNVLDKPDHVFPGMDLKFKLFDEKKFRPEISIGLQSAFGHRRMAGEYLAFSKRYHEWDFTAGFGWGRFGTRHNTPSPLDWTGSYFDSSRKLDGEKPNGPEDWFTGDTGVFGGIEYDTPLDGLSLKADISSDAYKAEKSLGIKRPWAYSFGMNYAPTSFLDAGIALMDRDTVMTRISLKTGMFSWLFSPADQSRMIALARDKNKNIVEEGKRNGLQIRNIKPDQHGMTGQVHLAPYKSTPYQLSQTWRIVTNKTHEENPARLRIEPVYFGLRAPAISIARHDLEEAAQDKGSAEEIWRNVKYDEELTSTGKRIKSFIPFLTLRENFSLGEDDAPWLYRTDILATVTKQMGTNFLSETTLRYNLFSNLHKLDNLRFESDDPVRSDVARFASDRFAIERLYVQGFKSFSTDWHITGSTGYLEEMFAGYHGEVLYRPWGKNWAAGLDAAYVIKRDHDTLFHMGFADENRIAGNLNFYYEFPNTDMTFQTGIGRYLKGDTGATMALKNRFANGSHVEAFMTATGQKDVDAYGSESNFITGIRLSFPLGNIAYIPDGSSIDINAMPVGRDSGQKLDIAHPLYDMTEPLSYRHLSQKWPDVAK